MAAQIPEKNRFAIPKWLKGWILPLALLLVWETLSRRSHAYALAFVPLEQIAASLLQKLGRRDVHDIAQRGIAE